VHGFDQHRAEPDHQDPVGRRRVFLPPTLIASIYGMNFHFIPELSWKYGYVMALVLMVISGLVPVWYFKKKGWL